jgi:hypothetical protein
LAAYLALVTPARGQDLPPSPPPPRAAGDAALRGAIQAVASEDEEPPPSPEQRARSRLVKGGAALFGAAYGVSLLGVAFENLACTRGPCVSVDHDDALAIPGVGPFVQMVWTTNPLGNVLLALDGLAQASGIAMITIGLVLKPEITISDAAAEAPRFALLPIVGPGRFGAGLGGTF